MQPTLTSITSKEVGFDWFPQVTVCACVLIGWSCHPALDLHLGPDWLLRGPKSWDSLCEELDTPGTQTVPHKGQKQRYFLWTQILKQTLLLQTSKAGGQQTVGKWKNGTMSIYFDNGQEKFKKLLNVSCMTIDHILFFLSLQNTTPGSKDETRKRTFQHHVLGHVLLL